MSAGAKFPRQHASKISNAFISLIVGSIDRLEVAGSIRRECAEVGDIEIVCIPVFGEIEKSGGLFAEKVEVNLLWRRLDELIDQGVILKHWNGSSHTWGDTMRRLDYGGMCIDVFTATESNWGSILLIRTGSSDYSRHAVDKMLRDGMYRQIGGVVKHVATGEIVPTPTEESFCALAGIKYRDPKERTGAL